MAHGNKTYTEEFKAQVIAELVGGASVRSLARKHNVPPVTIRHWRIQWGIQAPVVAPKNEVDIQERGLRLLLANLDALEAIAAHAKDKKWLAKQQAAGLAIFAGVLTDKAFVILDSYLRAVERDRQNPPLDVPRVPGPRPDN